MSNIRYTKKLSTPDTQIKNSYKSPSVITFKSNKQSFSDYGINNHSHFSGIHSDQSPNPRGEIYINHSRQPGMPIQLSNLDEEHSRELVKNGYCYNHITNLNNLNTNLGNAYKLEDPILRDNLVNELNEKIEQEQYNQAECIDNFIDNFKNLNKHIDKLSFSNIMPSNIPAMKSDIFPSSFSSCRNSTMFNIDNQNLTDGYSSSTKPIELEPSDNKPVYGTTQAFKITGPRIFDSTFNTNTGSELNTTNSGYNITTPTDSGRKYNNVLSESFKFKKLVESDNTVNMSPGYCCDTNQACNYKKRNYKLNNNIYNKDCGTKSTFGSISNKIESNPQSSYFVKNNIIGNNTNNINKSSFFFRNKATFNNETLQNSNTNLNDLKAQSHTNYITNTNKLRDEFNNNYLVQKSDKIKNNLLFRG
jgi:hypothetical protein